MAERSIGGGSRPASLPRTEVYSPMTTALEFGVTFLCGTAVVGYKS